MQSSYDSDRSDVIPPWRTETSKDSSSSGVQPLAVKKSNEQASGVAATKASHTVVLRDVQSCFLRALQTSADNAGAHLPELLLVSTLYLCERKFDAAVNLITSARRHGAQVEGEKTLDDTEFQYALTWLKNIYQEKFMTWPGLKKAINHWNNGWEYSHAKKSVLRDNVRRGFRTFCLQLLGGQNIVMATLRHGFSTPDSLAGIANEIYKPRAQGEGQENKTSSSHPDFAAEGAEANLSLAQIDVIEYALRESTQVLDAYWNSE